MSCFGYNFRQYSVNSNCFAICPYGSDNRRICGSLMLAQIPTTVGTSHIPETLSEIALRIGGESNENWR